MGKWNESKDDRPGSPKIGISIVRLANRSKKQKLEIATCERITPIVLGSVRIGWESGSNPMTIGLIRSEIAFSIFVFCFDLKNQIAIHFGPGRLIDSRDGRLILSRPPY